MSANTLQNVQQTPSVKIQKPGGGLGTYIHIPDDNYLPDKVSWMRENYGQNRDLFYTPKRTLNAAGETGAAAAQAEIKEEKVQITKLNLHPEVPEPGELKEGITLNANNLREVLYAINFLSFNDPDAAEAYQEQAVIS